MLCRVVRVIAVPSFADLLWIGSVEAPLDKERLGVARHLLSLTKGIWKRVVGGRYYHQPSLTSSIMHVALQSREAGLDMQAAST